MAARVPKNWLPASNRRRNPKRTAAARVWWSSMRFSPPWTKLSAAQKKEAEEFYLIDNK